MSSPVPPPRPASFLLFLLFLLWPHPHARPPPPPPRSTVPRQHLQFTPGSARADPTRQRDDFSSALLHCMQLCSPDQGNSPGHRFWTGRWGHARRQEHGRWIRPRRAPNRTRSPRNPLNPTVKDAQKSRRQKHPELEDKKQNGEDKQKKPGTKKIRPRTKSGD